MKSPLGNSANFSLPAGVPNIVSDAVVAAPSDLDASVPLCDSGESHNPAAQNRPLDELQAKVTSILAVPGLRKGAGRHSPRNKRPKGRRDEGKELQNRS